MAEFGKRGAQAGVRAARAQRIAPGQQMSAPASRLHSETPDLLSASEKSQIVKGQMPVWASMSRTQVGLFALLMPILIAAALWFYGPGVIRDHAYAGTFQVASDLRAADGKCTRHMFTITLCSAQLRSLRAGEGNQSVHFMMFFTSGGGEMMLPVRSSADPSVVGIKYAAEDVLMNRTLSLVAGMVFFGWIGWIYLNGLRTGRYKGGAAYEEALLCAAASMQAA